MLLLLLTTLLPLSCSQRDGAAALAPVTLGYTEDEPIVLYRSFTSSSEREAALRFLPVLEPSRISGVASLLHDRPVHQSTRNSSVYFLSGDEEHDRDIAGLKVKMAGLVGLPRSHGERLQVQQCVLRDLLAPRTAEIPSPTRERSRAASPNRAPVQVQGRAAAVRAPFRLDLVLRAGQPTCRDGARLP